MKRTLKKTLVMVSVIAAFIILFAFSTFAATCEAGRHSYNSDLDKVIYPTCTEGGYTIMYCGNCNEEMGIKDELDKTGHRHPVTDYKPVSQDGGNYFTFECDCANVDRNTGIKCNDHTIKRDETGHEMKYYSVMFCNTWDTASHDESITYTKLANAWETELLGTVYVAQGDTAVYTGVTPTREKDRDFGKYVFNGWDTSLENITENTVANAVFRGETVDYTVTFVDGDGKLISKAFTVAHGDTNHGAQGLFVNNPPTKTETSLFKYEFVDWNTDITAFYDTITVRPQFRTIEKVYTYVYHDSTGEPFYSIDLSYSGKAPEFTNAQKNQYLAKADDDIYMYEWTGEWEWRNDYMSVTMNNVPQYIPGSIQEGEEIHLYPTYNRKIIKYDVVVSVSFIDENPYYDLDDFIVQLKDANNQLIAYGKTDENGKFSCKVSYAYPIYVTVTSEDTRCSGQATINTLYKGYTTSCHVRLDAEASVDNPIYNCGCICHSSFFKPIWVRVLNILYNLFNIKFVCCDDMYVSIGDLLVYGQ